MANDASSVHKTIDVLHGLIDKFQAGGLRISYALFSGTGGTRGRVSVDGATDGATFTTALHDLTDHAAAQGHVLAWDQHIDSYNDAYATHTAHADLLEQPSQETAPTSQSDAQPAPASLAEQPRGSGLFVAPQAQQQPAAAAAQQQGPQSPS